MVWTCSLLLSSEAGGRRGTWRRPILKTTISGDMLSNNSLPCDVTSAWQGMAWACCGMRGWRQNMEAMVGYPHAERNFLRFARPRIGHVPHVAQRVLVWRLAWAFFCQVTIDFVMHLHLAKARLGPIWCLRRSRGGAGCRMDSFPQVIRATATICFGQVARFAVSLSHLFPADMFRPECCWPALA